MMTATGFYTVAYIYCIIGMVCPIFIYLFVPETKGKTLEQIQEYFELKVEKKIMKNDDELEA